MLYAFQVIRHIRNRLPVDLFLGVAIDNLCGRVPRFYISFKVRSDDSVRGVAYQALDIFLVLHDLAVEAHYLFLVKHPVGDVLYEHHRLGYGTVLIKGRVRAQLGIVQSKRLCN